MPVAFTITPEAQSAFAKLTEDKKADYVRVTAGQACGCGRIGYQMHWETEKGVTDEAVDASGLVILIDQESRPHLEGGIIDYKKEAMQEGFFISNPHAQTGCSCGGH